MARIAFPVTGMTCAACQSFVQKTLEQQPGVEAATVNLMLHNATVVYDPAQVDPAKLVAAVEDTGYGAHLAPERHSALEEQEAQDRADDAEFRSLRAKAIFALGAGAVSIALMAFGHSMAFRWAQLIVTLATMSWAGRGFYAKAWGGALSMNTLIALGTGSAFLWSAFVMFVPGYGHDVYFEGVLFILGFILLGNTFEARARRRTAFALRGLVDLQPKRARVERDGAELELPLDSLVLGDIIVARPGERIAADGTLRDGAGSIDESMLTGEPMPVEKTAGDAVHAGTLNRSGAFHYRADRIGAETRLDEIVRLLRSAQGDRAPIQRLADRISAVFVPTVLVLAAGTLAAWLLLRPGEPARAVTAAVAVLIIACPCAMGLAVPAAVMVATGRAARLGLLIRGGETLERLAAVDTVVFDKTGTLTEGRPEVTGIEWQGEVDQATGQRWIAALEKMSEHPLAEALVRHISTALPPAGSFEAVPGEGVRGRVEGHEILAGRRQFLERHAIVTSSFTDPDSTALWAAIDGKAVAVVRFGDPLRESAAPVVAALKTAGIRVVMVTGDNQASAQRAASQAGIDEVIAGVLPAGKLEAIEGLRKQGRHVAMAGDGINDAPALAAADVGMAMATGTDIAIEAADVTLLRADLRVVSQALELARTTLRTMRQNLFWAFLYNVICIPVAAFGLLNPVWAGAAMALSSVSVVTNSLRIR